MEIKNSMLVIQQLFKKKIMIFIKQIWIKIQIIKKLAEKADNQFYGKKELYLFQRTPAHLFILRHNAWYKKKEKKRK